MGRVLLECGGVESSGMLVKFSSDDSCSSYSDHSSANDGCCSTGARVLDVGMEDCSLLGESVVRGNGKRFLVEILTFDCRQFGRFGGVGGGRRSDGRCGGGRLLKSLKLLGEFAILRLRTDSS